MINWSIVGSNDGIQWNVLDQKNNTQELNGAFHSHYWTIKNDNPEYYQYIRLKGTDQTTNSEWKSLRFSEIEFFGYIFNTNNNLTHQ
ncbi:hypothetical protein TRFO_28334 [Tritrichomonas foetus]|uniref:F5/8 type C domain-containing protein n=1 Tax=Tritrichomonas foetus TaxID=1144522 RepID=A0A1J4JYJ3_9EUKA|nr:hypothetical protein TRFO_28334 [Tritrichomonas foetus]|eukprot:OHT04225.1 hypothetical protein TRFO_28334 [Tritrichomonas foetus]